MRSVLCLILLAAGTCFGAVSVSSPINNATVSSPAHFVATATTPCTGGISAMGIYTATNVLAYKVRAQA